MQRPQIQFPVPTPIWNCGSRASGVLFFTSAGTRHIHGAHDCIYACKIFIHIRENKYYKRENWSGKVTSEVCLRLCLLTDSSTCCSHFVQKSNGAECQKNPRERMPFCAEVKSLLNRNQTLQLSSCFVGAWVLT